MTHLPRLKALREQLSLTQDTLALISKVPKAVIVSYEDPNSTAQYEIRHVRRLANVLQVYPDHLIHEPPAPKIPTHYRDLRKEERDIVDALRTERYGDLLCMFILKAEREGELMTLIKTMVEGLGEQNDQT